MMHRLSDSSMRRVTTATDGVPFAMWRGVDLYLRLLEQRTIAIASPGARVLKIVSWTLQLLFILGIGSCFLQVERASQCTSEFCYVLSDYMEALKSYTHCESHQTLSIVRLHSCIWKPPAWSN
ncbi:hypothetical protein M405DRAFT_173019 [Rhizopogon salebrosus TDB-379]|nr:hypothetical protein M405DRAFT_173019 [Rhizopogon salebrosus TDB-379]